MTKRKAIPQEVRERVEQEKARRLVALERAQALGERIHAERPAYDVDSVELLRQMREEPTMKEAEGEP